MRRPRLSALLLVGLSAGCGDGGDGGGAGRCLSAACELGECDDPANGRTPVSMGDGTVAYAGQAIMLKSCGNGCHDSTAEGIDRAGAPEGLDFDLRPVRFVGDVSEDVEIEVPAELLEELSDRQADIFERRERIWSVVQNGSMPKAGPEGDAHRAIRPGQLVENGTCEVGSEVRSIEDQDTRELLRKWLACGSPLVESNQSVQSPRGGTVGDIWPVCSGP